MFKRTLEGVQKGGEGLAPFQKELIPESWEPGEIANSQSEKVDLKRLEDGSKKSR